MRRALDDVAWVWTDDDQHRRADHVIGARKLTMFGPRRGYWTRGPDDFPTLCATFGITAEVQPHTARDFLAEIAHDAARLGPEVLLADEPALPRMLLANYAYLGSAGASGLDASLPFILAHHRGPKHGAHEAHTLVAANHPKLMRSDTPNLEARFSAAHEFFVAASIAGEERQAIDAFHAALGVDTLRDRLRVEIAARAGRDRTADVGAEISRLRGTITALGGALDRVALRQPSPHWVHTERLAALGGAGPIRVLEQLSARYVLEGIGGITVPSMAVYDPSRATLLVDTDAARHPSQHTTALALGLMPTILDGPGEDDVVSTVALLLAMGSSERMHAHLDQRHYPSLDAERNARDLLAERMGAVLDFGVHHQLARKFETLRDAPVERWRDAEVLEGALGDEDAKHTERARWARAAAPNLLAAVGVEGDAPLLEVLITLLTVDALDALPADVLSLDDDSHAQHDDRDTLAQDIIPNLPDEPQEPAPPERTFDETVPEPGPEPVDWGAARDALLEDARRPRAQLGPGRALFDRVRRFFTDDPKPTNHPMPEWAQGAGNPFGPRDAIGAQLWVREENLREASALHHTHTLNFVPSVLPRPHLYAIHTPAATFDPTSQAWLPTKVPPASAWAPHAPSGRRARFEGSISPGLSQLPIPMHAALTGQPMDTRRGVALRTQRNRDGSVWIFNPTHAPAHIEYAVDLGYIPALTQTSAEPSGMEELRRPTLALKDLPAAVRRWVQEERARARPAWQRAVAAQAFVLEHYTYDLGFLDKPRARRALELLRPGRGHHHIEVLHAGAGDGVLGRGVCYELNVMVAEVLRHLDVPTMIGSCWVLDRGSISGPDHLVALAMLEDPHRGLVPVPLDATSDEQGAPQRPLHSDSRASRPTAPSPWESWRGDGAAGASAVDDAIAQTERAEATQAHAELALLERALTHAHAVLGLPAPSLPRSGAAASRRDAALEQGARVLGSAQLFSALVGVLRGDYVDVAQLPDEVRELVRRDVVRVRTVSRYHVTALA